MPGCRVRQPLCDFVSDLIHTHISGINDDSVLSIGVALKRLGAPKQPILGSPLRSTVAMPSVEQCLLAADQHDAVGREFNVTQSGHDAVDGSLTHDPTDNDGIALAALGVVSGQMDDVVYGHAFGLSVPDERMYVETPVAIDERHSADPIT